jgi:hypothetical protein
VSIVQTKELLIQSRRCFSTIDRDLNHPRREEQQIGACIFFGYLWILFDIDDYIQKDDLLKASMHFISLLVYFAPSLILY